MANDTKMVLTEAMKEKLDWPLAQLQLPVRILNNLENHKGYPCLAENCPVGKGVVHRFLYIRDILRVSPECLRTMNNVGDTTLNLLLSRLSELGFRPFNPATDVLPDLIPPTPPPTPEPPPPAKLKRFRFGMPETRPKRRRK